MNTRRCPDCKGYGTEGAGDTPSEDKPCQVCKGEGTVPAERRTEGEHE